MTIKTLPVNDNIVTQENGWQCGPATTQNAIWAKTRTVVSESQLARELGTTVNGTDSIEYLDRVLGNHLGVDHATQWITNDPPTPAQVDEFWERLKNSVDAGFGVAMNWIAPPSSYPRAVRGQSPSYAGGVVYHYVLAGGYDDEGHRWVFVIDSGFWPKTYWITVEQCMSLIAGKGYTYPRVGAGFLGSLSDADQRAVWSGFAQLGGQS